MKTTKTILVKTSAFDTKRSKFEKQLINDLIKVHEDDWSPREKAFMETLMEFGELYPMTIIQNPSIDAGTNAEKEYITDLGHPESTISVTLPWSIPEDKATEAIQRLAESLV